MMIGAVARCADGCVIIQSPYCNAPVVPHVIVIKKHTSGHHDNHDDAKEDLHRLAESPYCNWPHSTHSRASDSLINGSDGRSVMDANDDLEDNANDEGSDVDDPGDGSKF